MELFQYPCNCKIQSAESLRACLGDANYKIKYYVLLSITLSLSFSLQNYHAVTGTGTGSGVACRKENEDPDPDTLYEYTVDEETGDYIIIPPKKPIKLPDENCKQQ